uniref:CUG-BP-and ETR-3-like factor 5 n=1 Tax=Aegilops tauschii TaxID=37682 RepID=R7W7V6_AEGTA
MAAFRREVDAIAGHFKGYKVEHIDRRKNEAADTLSRLGSQRKPVPPNTFLDVLVNPSVKLPTKEDLAVPDPEAQLVAALHAIPDWTIPYLAYMTRDELPEDEILAGQCSLSVLCCLILIYSILYIAGCCFLICPSREEADKAVNAYHNKRTLPGAPSPLQVKYADGELERLEHKLFIGMLPKNVTDAEMTDLFSQYGNIKDLQILRGSQQTSKAGCAFLKYETKEQAVAAIEALNGKHKIEGSSVPLVVKWADTEKERQARKAQKAQFPPSNMSNANAMQQSSLFGALQMGYVPPYNGFGYQPQGTYGLMQYPLSPMQNQAGFQNMVQPVNQGSSIRGVNSELSPNSVARSFNSMQLGSPYPAGPGMQYPGSYPGGGINSRPYMNSLNSVKVPNANATSPTSSSTSSNTGPQLEGFVSYDSPAPAQAAISMMNGFQLGGKKLKVQLKRDNSKHNKLY